MPADNDDQRTLDTDAALAADQRMIEEATACAYCGSQPPCPSTCERVALWRCDCG